ncbi:hypothetical protein BDN67DRAFT_405093 [Paxillus ammoniavirescens]|nr:hypothetical protein BDN67DRAFT_405093 [Paxillus ammoniavirescens]
MLLKASIPALRVTTPCSQQLSLKECPYLQLPFVNLRRTTSTRVAARVDVIIPPPPDETRPLISRPSTPPIITNYPPHTAAGQSARSYLSENPPFNQPVPQWARPARFGVNGSAQNYSYAFVTRSLVARGWVEFSLPHGLRYYENRDSHAIMDIDLRNLARLDEVSVTIEAAKVVPEGCEMWICGTHGGKKGWRKQKAASEPVIS